MLVTVPAFSVDSPHIEQVTPEPRSRGLESPDLVEEQRKREEAESALFKAQSDLRDAASKHTIRQDALRASFKARSLDNSTSQSSLLISQKALSWPSEN